MLRIVIVVGNPKPKSRTRRIAELLIGRMFAAVKHQVEIIDLAEYADQVLMWPSDTMAELNERVANANLVVFASPTYKATYTGLLKAFLDRYPANGLKNVTAIALMTGADFGHSMGPTHNMVPLLLELGALVPTRGLYFNTAQYDKVQELVAARAEETVASLRALTPIVDAMQAGPIAVDLAS
jgi:FMN reductase